MMVLLIILLVLAIAGDVAINQKYLNEKRANERLLKAAEKMILKDEDDVLAYLEAHSEIHPQAGKILKQLKALPAIGQSTVTEGTIPLKPEPPLEPVQTVPLPPAWIHDNTVRIPADEQWELFLKDMRREDYGEDALRVLYHWVNKLGFKFTLAEQSIIVDMFESAEDRRLAREIFAKEKEKPAPSPKPASGGPSASG